MNDGIITSESLAEASSPNGPSFDSALVEASGIWRPENVKAAGRCPLCSSPAYRTVVIRQDGLPIQECNSCSLAYVDPRPSSSQLAYYYGNGYFSGEKDFFKGKDYCLERDKAISEKAVTGYEEIVANFDLTDKVILDIGCASGALLHLVRQHNSKQVIGVDTAEYPIAFGRSRYGLDLRYGTLHTLKLPNGHFDLVTMIDVLEHIEDLDAFLQELKRILRRGGDVFIITPNYLSHAFAGSEWTCLHKDFEHLQYFGIRSIKKLCRRSGFSLVKLWTDSLPFRTFQYPQVHPNGSHRLFHPLTAIRNGLAQFKYRRGVRKMPLIGANLNVVLQSE